MFMALQTAELTYAANLVVDHFKYAYTAIFSTKIDCGFKFCKTELIYISFTATLNS